MIERKAFLPWLGDRIKKVSRETGDLVLHNVIDSINPDTHLRSITASDTADDLAEAARLLEFARLYKDISLAHEQIERIVEIYAGCVTWYEESQDYTAAAVHANALVDFTNQADETLLPLLLSQNAPLGALVQKYTRYATPEV